MMVSMVAVTAVGCGSSNGTDTKGADANQSDATSDWDETSDVTIVSREDGSGTRGAFIELFGIEEKQDDGTKVDMTTTDAQITNNTSVMLTTEYYGAAEPPVRCGESHLSGLTEPLHFVY